MHWDWNAILTLVVGIATVVLRQVIATPKAHDVAAQIRHLADDAAAVVVVSSGNAPWAVRLEAVVQRLGEMLPDTDPSVVERAATGALMRLAPPIPAPAATP